MPWHFRKQTYIFHQEVQIVSSWYEASFKALQAIDFLNFNFHGKTKLNLLYHKICDQNESYAIRQNKKLSTGSLGFTGYILFPVLFKGYLFRKDFLLYYIL